MRRPTQLQTVGTRIEFNGQTVQATEALHRIGDVPLIVASNGFHVFAVQSTPDDLFVLS